MLRKALSTALVAVAVAMSGCQTHPHQTAKPSAPAVADVKLWYLDPTAVEQLEASLPAPPVDRGPITRGEGDLMLAMRAEASDAAIARARSEESFRPWTYAQVLGPGFSAEKMPLTAVLLRQAELDSGVVSRALKSKWSRKRPSLQDDRITAILGVPDDDSYPSGHSVRAMLWAHILTMLAPEKQDALLQRARLVAYDRVIGGVHYPTDVAAGLTLGGLVADEIARSPAFQADLAKARTEWPPISP